jgi:hypothetical protein
MNTRTLVLALVFAVGSVACGDDEPDKTDDTSAPDTTPDDTGPDTTLEDADMDGYTSDVDCDDNNYQVHPDAEEFCDSIDNDCDDEVDEDFDADGDGHYNAEACDYGDDCDDSDGASHPGADEVPYDGVDQDCDGEDVVDVDGDGFIADEAGGNDCDDENADVNPAQTEIPFDGLDNDCVDGDSADADGDGYNDADYGGDDCDDADDSIHPGAWDWWNDGLDADCSGDDVGDYLELEAADITVDGVWDGSSSSGYFYDLLGYGMDACDIDEDGLDDIIIGAPFSNNYGGGVGIWYGNGADIWTGGMLLEDADTLIAGTGYDFIGFDVHCTDIDGDGHMDLVTDRGEIDYSSYQADFGLLIYYGDGKAFDPSVTDNEADAELTLEIGVPAGVGVVYSNTWEVGDLDGDGASEMVIEWGSDKIFAEADLLVVPGGLYSGNLEASDYIEDWAEGAQEFSLAHVRVLQDIDGDGLADLFAGEAYYSTSYVGDSSADTGFYMLDNWSKEGRALLVSDLSSLDANTLEAAAYATISGVTEAMFGWYAASGDFDDDGSEDTVISAVLDDSGADNGGGLYTFYAATSLFAGGGEFSTSDAGGHTYGIFDDGELGIQLEAAGDVDGDGYEDLLVSEPGGGTFDVGRTYLLSGALLSSEAAVDDASLMGFEGSDSDNAFATDILVADFDGDDISDIAISALGWDDTDDASIHAGRVILYLSSSFE